MMVFSACRPHYGSRTSPSSPERPQQTTATSSVEEQLLNTIQEAERLGPNNPLLFSSIYSLATYYRDRKAYDKAVNQYQRALSIKEDSVGPTHPDVAVILQQYAQVLKEAGRSEEATPLLARAQFILQESPSPSPKSADPP